MEYANNGGEKCKPVFLQSEKDRVFPYYMYRYMLYLQSISPLFPCHSPTTHFSYTSFVPSLSLAYPLLKFFHLPLSPHDLRVG